MNHNASDVSHVQGTAQTIITAVSSRGITVGRDSAQYCACSSERFGGPLFVS